MTAHGPYSSGPGLEKLGRRIRRIAISKSISKLFGWDCSSALKVGGRLTRFFDQGLFYGLPSEAVPPHIFETERVAARIAGRTDYLTSLRIPRGLHADRLWHWADWALIYERILKTAADNAVHHYWVAKTIRITGMTRVNALVTKDGHIETDVAQLLDQMGLCHGFVSRWAFCYSQNRALSAKAFCDHTFPFPETIEVYICLCASLVRDSGTAEHEEREAAKNILAAASP